jgi:integrase
MSIEKLPDGRGYKVRWRDSAGRSRRKTVLRQRDAISLDGEMKRKKQMGELIVHERGRETLEDFWTLWWRRYALVHLTPRSQTDYQWLWCKHLEPHVGRYRLRDLQPEHVAELTSRLSQTLAPSTVRKCLAVLQGVLQRAVEWKYIGANPAAGTRKPRLVQREGCGLTADELAALTTELPDLRSQAIVRTLASSGMRPGELRALRWGDVHHGEIVVTRAASRDAIGPTKTGARRQIELRPGASSALNEWRLARGRAIDPRGLVFPGADGKLWTDAGYRMWSRQVFQPAAARAGLKGIVVYDLRHTFVSTLIAENRDVITIADQAGHSPTMTLSTYGHLLKRCKSVPSECPDSQETG